jgi:CDP-diacylglycerol--glycerol-3-phosphate 3-phosphatidyltransferase
MTLPMFFTIGRIALAPVFFLFYQLAGQGSPWLLLGVCSTFTLIELSDLFDGYFARRRGQESELGKVLDPCADSLSRLTYFLALTSSGIMPVWILLILIYRDVAVAYIRVMVAREKVFMSARASGKLKAWIYALAGIGGTVEFSLGKLGWLPAGMGIIHGINLGLFILAGAVAVWSLVDYSAFFMKNFRKTS